MALIDWLRNLLSVPANDSRPIDWPPPHLEREWALIEGYVRRYENDRAAMLRHDPVFKNATDDRKSTYTPVPLAAEMVRLSSALLFSAEPKFTNEAKGSVLERVVEANDPGELLLETGEHAAVQGHIGLRVIRDEEVSDQPLVTWVPANRVVWRVRHGRFVVGGYVVIERRPNPFSHEVYRLVEDHKKGVIERALYKGTRTSLGSTIPQRAWLEEFRGLPERTDHRMNAPTLYRWNNVPGGRSDLAGLDPLFDRLNEAESVGVAKLRKSEPFTVVDRKLADRNGVVDLSGVIFTGSSSGIAGESVAKTVETVQPELQSEDHVRYVEHVRELILQMAGYSLASWGLDDGGSADSGKALRLRQARTLLTKAGKERSARSAIVGAFAAACAWSEGASDVGPYRPELLLGDGLPTDPLEDAQEVATKRGAGVASLEQGVRELHPDWDEDAIAAEVERIEEEERASMPPAFGLGPSEDDGTQDGEKTEEEE